MSNGTITQSIQFPAECITDEQKRDHALSLVAASEITIDDYRAWDAQRVAKLEENAKASGANGQRGLSCKVSEKGAVSVYGLNARFPMTLYGDQWARLFAYREQLEAFIVANKSKLSVK